MTPIAHIRHIISQTMRKLHILDYIIIGCFIMAVGIFFILRFSQKTVWIPITLRVGSEDILWKVSTEPWYVTGLTKGMISYDLFGKQNMEITNVQSFDIGEGKRETYVTMNIKTTYDTKNKTYTFNLQPVTVGSPFKITIQKQDLQGIITFIGDDKPTVTKTIEARLLYTYPWVANSFSKGQQLKDQSGNVIAEILSVDVQNAKQYEFSDWQGRTFVINGEDTTKKDVIFTIKLQAKEYNDVFYFTGSPLKIGNQLHLEFPTVSAQTLEISAILP